MSAELTETDIYDLANDYVNNRVTRQELQENFTEKTVLLIMNKADEIRKHQNAIKFGILKRALLEAEMKYKMQKRMLRFSQKSFKKAEIDYNQVLLAAKFIARQQVAILKQQAWIGVRSTDSPFLKSLADREIQWGGERIKVISQGTANWKKVVEGLEKLDPEIVRFFEPVQKEFAKAEFRRNAITRAVELHSRDVQKTKQAKNELQNKLDFWKLGLVAEMMENVANSI